MLEAIFSKAARALFDNLDERDQDDVLHLVLLLEQNPAVDNVLKFYVPIPPIILRAPEHDWGHEPFW